MTRHGFSGSESEWLASLVGAGSGDMKASDYDPSGDVARAGGVGAYVLTAASARQEKIARGTLTLSDAWAGAGPYTQTVTVTGAACGAGSRVDLQPSAAQLAALIAIALLFPQSGALKPLLLAGAAMLVLLRLFKSIFPKVSAS